MPSSFVLIAVLGAMQVPAPAVPPETPAAPAADAQSVAQPPVAEPAPEGNVAQTPATGTEEVPPGPAAAPDDAPRLVGALPEPDPDKQRLVAGAPLYNPNVAVHIVQQKPRKEQGRHELTLYPAVGQVNGKFTQHYGTALAYTYHLHENLGLYVAPRYNWAATESAFNLELVDKVRQQGQPATTLLLNWAATGGVEITPLYGKFAIYDGLLAQFSVVLLGGAGIGQTSHLLKPITYTENNERRAETYGDTGRRFVGEIGGGLRIGVGDRFMLRLEVRDLVYTARVEEVNGCNLADLDAMLDVYESTPDPTSLEGVPVRGSCNLGAFQGEGAGTGENRIHDVPRAHDLVKEPTSDVLNNVGFHAGFSFLF